MTQLFELAFAFCRYTRYLYDYERRYEGLSSELDLKLAVEKNSRGKANGLKGLDGEDMDEGSSPHAGALQCLGAWLTVVVVWLLIVLL